MFDTQNQSNPNSSKVTEVAEEALEVPEVAKDTTKDSGDRPSSENFIENESPEE